MLVAVEVMQRRRAFFHAAALLRPRCGVPRRLGLLPRERRIDGLRHPAPRIAPARVRLPVLARLQRATGPTPLRRAPGHFEEAAEAGPPCFAPKFQPGSSDTYAARTQAPHAPSTAPKADRKCARRQAEETVFFWAHLICHAQTHNNARVASEGAPPAGQRADPTRPLLDEYKCAAWKLALRPQERVRRAVGVRLS